MPGAKTLLRRWRDAAPRLPRGGRETVITYTQPRIEDGWVRWRGTASGDDEHTVSISFTSPDPGRFRPSGRPWLLVFLELAMRRGRPLVVDGPVDQGTLDGLMEWQEAQAAWHPREVSVVPIRAEIEDGRRAAQGDGAITAFSGGVDSAFTLVRHARGDGSSRFRRTRLAAGLMVHGFDIDVRNKRDFPPAFERSRRMLAAYGVPAYQLRTNLRRVGRRVGYPWGASSHGISTAAALACLEQFFALSIIPASYPYDHPMLPWGSTPSTDHLLGSSTRPLWHDGARFDKLDKVSAIAHEAPIAADLRVCFKGEWQDRNCGSCFKCLSTQACYWINGVERPACFGAGSSVRDLAGLELNDSYKLRLGRRLHEAALGAGRADIAAELETALTRAQP